MMHISLLQFLYLHFVINKKFKKISNVFLIDEKNVGQQKFLSAPSTLEQGWFADKSDNSKQMSCFLPPHS